MSEPNVDELYKEFSSSTNQSPINNGVDVDALHKEFSNPDRLLPPPSITNPPGPIDTQNVKDFGTGVKRGATNVLDTGAQGIGYLDEKLTEGGKARREAFQSKSAQEYADYQRMYGKNTAAQLGETAGEIGMTAPLVPGGIVKGINAATRALPTVLSTGEKIAPSVINRLMGSVGTGAVGGATYGLGTSGVGDEDVASKVGNNVLAGAVGGPILDRAGALAKAIPSISKGLSVNAQINLISNKYGLNPKAAKQVLDELSNEGMSLSEAEYQLGKFGPDATLGDLTPALQKFVGALAQRGGRATSIVENRYALRGDTADNSAHNIMVSKLGPKPDMDAEREAIVKEAKRLTSSDYNTAHASTDKLPIDSLVDHIDNALENAVGQKANVLKEIKGYLYKPDDTLKNSVASLHEVRQGIDDILNKRGDSLSPNAKREVSTVRNSLDTILKTNPQMASADAKFADKMTLADGLDIGNTALNKGNYENFEKTFNAASPELKATIKKGMRAQVGDMMEQAARGELAGAQQLLSRKSANRKKLELAFGSDGTEVLDALASQANLRATEGMVKSGSRTAINTRINNLLDNTAPKGILGDSLTGFALDATSGSLGTGTAIMAAKRTGQNILTKFGENRKDAMAESLADLLSQNGSSLRTSFDALNKISSIQSRIKAKPFNLTLPVKPITSASIVGKPVNDYAKDRADYYLK